MWWVAISAVLTWTAIAVVRRITWYLAVDQYGYLSFAQDLLRGTILHHWPPLDALAAHIPARTDVLFQTYVFDGGRTYSRYAPGFALLLAGWMGVFGAAAAPYLTPAVFLALLIVLLLFQQRIWRSRWRAGAGTALVVLLPSSLHLWALTIVRDLPTHLTAFGGLLLLLPSQGRRLRGARVAAAAAALGFAISIRPDAVLYVVPALLLSLERLRRERAWTRLLGAGAVALLLGLAPLLLYNWAATGNPLRVTQGMELAGFLSTGGIAAPIAAGAVRAHPSAPVAPEVDRSGDGPAVGYPSRAWHGGTMLPVQGGGLRLANLPRVLPQNLELLRAAYGIPLLALALWGAVLALVQRRLLFLTAVPYVALALLVYSCWSRPDDRYLAGLHLFLPLLVIEGALGTLDLVRRSWRLGHEGAARCLAIGFAIALPATLLAAPPDAGRGALAATTWLIAAIATLAALAVAIRPERRAARFAAPALMLSLTLLVCRIGWRDLASPSRAPFQQEQVERARETIARAVGRNAVVITTEDVGRPAENIDHYSGVAHALYLTDLRRWRLGLADAADLLQRGGFETYLLLPADGPARAAVFADLEGRQSLEMVADIPPEAAIDYFVAAAFHPGGVHLRLDRLTPTSPGPIDAYHAVARERRQDVSLCAMRATCSPWKRAAASSLALGIRLPSPPAIVEAP